MILTFYVDRVHYSLIHGIANIAVLMNLVMVERAIYATFVGVSGEFSDARNRNLHNVSPRTRERSRATDETENDAAKHRVSFCRILYNNIYCFFYLLANLKTPFPRWLSAC